METPNSKFQFNGYTVTESIVRIKPGRDKPGKLGISFEVNGITNNLCNDKYAFTITTVVKDENEAIYIKVSFSSEFSFDSSIDKETLESLCSKNAPVILFPYIRAYISAVTALSGIAPVNIPTLNFGKVMQSDK